MVVTMALGSQEDIIITLLTELNEMMNRFMFLTL